ncbi:peptidoglycan/xylan/chitin deacetylase (PgdA/CDA1 family) [Laceyella sediminis]|jgi:peptidoglycan/xylan/chitin deacetylase (PgdA/CDA1 family)|uniref:Peptidoglycan/xylan/chitin deacetylase (PgdA/CDA1 family) n=1 Tax=Laceyella sediminis TaxID=573074 RepID=A0ABX5ESD1_9BACL|nr:polysaccharide deacetylase family protein [Laceyella sediminis]PRZ15807.1 peptidoglycan/xylan/chitin deacetylase (PgdA/CDA1 family) [Laceyella sediminis]
MPDQRKMKWGILGLCAVCLIGCIQNDEALLAATKYVQKARQEQKTSSGNGQLPRQPVEQHRLSGAKDVMLGKPPMAADAKKTAIPAHPRLRKRVALTFDDGPDLQYTPQVLSVLKKERVPATFFVVGKMVQKYPKVVRRMVREGHVVGNHSYSHRELTKLTMAQLDAEIKLTDALIYHAIHKKPLFFRPPFGVIDEKITAHLTKKGYKMIPWNVDTLDWQEGNSSDDIVNKVKKDIEAGGIVLQHSFGGPQIENTVKALPRIIAYLRDNGYEFVTIDQLYDIQAYSETGNP